MQIYGPPINLNQAEVFVMKNEHSYAAFLGVLSAAYMKAHASSNLREGPYKVAIIIDKTMTVPYNNQPESSQQRLQFIIEHLKQPAGGIEVGLFLGTSNKFDGMKVGMKHAVSQCWPLKNSPEKGTKLTANVPPSQLRGSENRVRFFTKNQIEKLVEQPIEFVDYYTPIQTVYNNLLDSKAHITYQGGTAWLSVCMDIPTIVVHPQGIRKFGLHEKYKIFGQDLGNINILNSANKIVNVRVHPVERHIDMKKLKGTIAQL